RSATYPSFILGLISLFSLLSARLHGALTWIGGASRIHTQKTEGARIMKRLFAKRSTLGMKSRRACILAMVIAIVAQPIANAAISPAQTSRGTVTGIVTDQQGAVISGANLELINKGTNQTRTTSSNDSGIYRFDAVDLGVYDLKVTAQ